MSQRKQNDMFHLFVKQIFVQNSNILQLHDEISCSKQCLAGKCITRLFCKMYPAVGCENPNGHSSLCLLAKQMSKIDENNLRARL